MEAKSIRSRIAQLALPALALVLVPFTAHAQFCPTGLELEAIALINAERVNAALAPVELDLRLVTASRLHSEDMAVNDFFSHTGSNGSTFSERITQAGYPSPRSENIAAGYSTAASVVTAWMNSPGHRANILDPSARHVGVGWAFDSNSAYGTYWTNNFGVSSDPPQSSCGGGDTTLPQVSMSAPSNGATVSGSIGITASASDNVGISGVQFMLDGSPLGPEDTLPPYAVQFDTTSVADGVHTLTAVARDAAGNQAISIPVAITISNSIGGGDPPNPEDPEDPEDDPLPDALPSTGPGTLDLSIELSSSGFRTIRADSDAGGVAHLELYIDGQLAATVQGASLEFDWDVRSLLGAYEVRVDGLDATGSEVLASTSLFYSVASTQVPSVSLDVVDLRIVGATFIRANADVPDATRVELYVDRELVLVKDSGSDIEYAWDPETGVAHEILFVAYNATGVAASVSIVHVE